MIEGVSARPPCHQGTPQASPATSWTSRTNILGREAGAVVLQFVEYGKPAAADDSDLPSTSAVKLGLCPGAVG